MSASVCRWCERRFSECACTVHAANGQVRPLRGPEIAVNPHTAEIVGFCRIVAAMFAKAGLAAVAGSLPDGSGYSLERTPAGGFVLRYDASADLAPPQGPFRVLDGGRRR